MDDIGLTGVTGGMAALGALDGVVAAVALDVNSYLDNR